MEASAQASSDLFSRLDADGSGTITREEFEKAGTVEPISLQMVSADPSRCPDKQLAASNASARGMVAWRLAVS